MSDTYSIRCPVCLAQREVPKDTRTDAEFTCAKCEHVFEFANALPVRLEQSVLAGDAPAVVMADSDFEARERLVMLVGVPLGVLCFWWFFTFTQPQNGPEFLAAYAFVGFSLLMLSNVVRWLYLDSFRASQVAAAVFVAMAIARYIDGTSQGMETFTIMWIMMCFGTITFFTRVSVRSGGRSGGSFFGSSCGGCGSGDGGGSCGGGGCGGCG